MKLFVYDEGELLNAEQTEIIQTVAVIAAERAGAPNDCCAELTIIADPEDMRELNRETRGIDGITDVLSFPALNFDENRQPVDIDPALDYVESKLYLGEIMICRERAVEQAQEYGHSINRELAFLTVHGLLHLLGDDHETQDDEREMFALQQEILQEGGMPR